MLKSMVTEVVKKDRKSKSILVKKDSTQERKATNMKDEVSQALNSIQGTESRFIMVVILL